MTYDWAKPGVKVVCINDGPYGGYCWGKNEAPKVGQVYTIKAVLYFDGVIFHLEEIKRDKEACDEWGNPDLGYGAHRFRPLITKSLPASLTNLLKNPKSVILPNEGNRWDMRKQKEKTR
ncbi:hypothetical protein EVB79_015 [Rhizobium phage RHph_N3_13]|nr:hypothetical protein EVB79_015 [Rhizobium phage RHph_N3_13]